MPNIILEESSDVDGLGGTRKLITICGLRTSELRSRPVRSDLSCALKTGLEINRANDEQPDTVRTKQISQSV